jgi:hypothetical protein
MTKPAYERGAQITYAIVSTWRGAPPRFAFPPKDVALMADLRDVGDKLARNDAARELVALLIKRCVERTGEAPTAMMLRIVLDMLKIPVEEVAPDELFRDVEFKVITRGN